MQSASQCGTWLKKWLTRQQFDALVLGLPWRRLKQMQAMTRV
jgi:hypothetical protein